MGLLYLLQSRVRHYFFWSHPLPQDFRLHFPLSELVVCLNKLYQGSVGSRFPFSRNNDLRLVNLDTKSDLGVRIINVSEVFKNPLNFARLEHLSLCED